jgi:hypothetical protein
MNVQAIHETTLATGGSSTDLLGATPAKGYMVSVHPQHGLIVPVSQFTPELIAEYVANQIERLHFEDHYLGTWIDSGRVYLDIALRVDRLEEALELGRRHNQLAVFDLETFESVEVT